MMYDELVLLVI